MNEQEKEWRAEFDKLGEKLVFENVRQGAIYNSEAKRQAAFRWLAEKSGERTVREEHLLWYSRWTFWAAVIAAALALIGIIVALLTSH